jgi:hypothetical protein
MAIFFKSYNLYLLILPGDIVLISRILLLICMRLRVALRVMTFKVSKMPYPQKQEAYY